MKYFIDRNQYYHGRGLYINYIFSIILSWNIIEKEKKTFGHEGTWNTWWSIG